MKYFNLKILLSCCLFFFSISSNAQKVPPLSAETASQVAKKQGNNRLYKGGAIGGHISNNSLYVSIAPQVGYRIVNGKVFKILPGVSFMYQYYQSTNGFFDFSSKNFSTNVYGPCVFTRFYLKNFFVHGEYRYLWYQASQYLENGAYSKISSHDDFLLVGIGMFFPVGRNKEISVSILIDVLKHKDNYKIHDNPSVNIAFSF